MRAPGARRARAQDSSDVSRADARERRDIVSGTVMPENRLIRFVADPEGNVVPDAAAKLPGRGLWVEASKAAIDKAVEKKLFSRAAKAQVTATADLSARAEKALLARMIGDLGLARRSGALFLGFDNVLRELQGPKPPKALIEAFDGAADGKRKLYSAAHRLELNCVVIECLTSAELGLALGRENVIHAAVQPGGLAERLTFDAERLSGFRPRNERDL
ncbi:MAG: RNA-binding protein [Alphaproteobacteria bacterium]|nr:RNA-binding protein [Alphaproteobacteria bacterium]